MVPPGWLTAVAWFWVLACLASAAAIVVDVLVRERRQMMKVMEWVWPITALYFGPIALWAYLRFGHQYSPDWRADHEAEVRPVPHWMRVGISTSHCGAGCTLGDIVAEWLVFALALTLFGQALFASYALDYTLAFSLGVVFQYFAIAQMGHATLGEITRRTLKADLFSLTAFEIGLFAWMGLAYFVFFTDPHLAPDQIVFWFMMQIGMMIGFLTSYPANLLLIRRGVKEAM
jgi:hypothetical protein